MSLLLFALLLTQTGQVTQAPARDATPLGRAALTLLTGGEFAKLHSQFTPQMIAALPASRLAMTWTALETQFGAFTSCADTSRTVVVDDKRMVITRCTFARGAVDVQFAFDPADKISGLRVFPAGSTAPPYEPPPYADPSRFTEHDVTVGTGQWALPATLTLPSGEGRVPVVILVHGSGPHDRDQSIGPNKPFKDLAFGLASRGIGVLRYEKRSKAHAGTLAGVASLTVKEEVIDDVGAAIDVVRVHPRVDARRIVVLGHSLGGTLVPRIAAGYPSLAGAIVMAGAASPIDELIVQQVRYLARVDGAVSPEEEAAIAAMEKNAAAIRALTSADAASPAKIVGAPASYWLDLRGYDPPAAARSLKMPLLVLQGERDYQVPVSEFDRWKSALAARSDVTFHAYAALNHLFMAGSGPSSPAEYSNRSHVAEPVIADIATWVRGLPAR